MMTNEEAHTILELMAIQLTGELAKCGHLSTEQSKLLGKELKAIDMAIEALTHEIRTETHGVCSDLISRQAAIDAIKKWNWQDVYLPIHYQRVLEEVPSADRPKGEWIDVTKHGGDFVVKCSECGCLQLETQNFCPNCGADMRGDNND